MLYSHLTEKNGEAQSCQNRTEQNRTEQNRTEQNRTEQNRTDNTLSIFMVTERPLYCARLNWRVPV